MYFDRNIRNLPYISPMQFHHKFLSGFITIILEISSQIVEVPAKQVNFRSSLTLLAANWQFENVILWQ